MSHPDSSSFIELITVSLSPSQSILALGGVISALPTPPYIRRFASSLLTRQILRPHGVRGLFEAVFGDDEENMAEGNDLDKLEHTANVLTAVPKDIDPKVRYSYWFIRHIHVKA